MVIMYQAHITQSQAATTSRFSWFWGILGPFAFSAVLFCYALGNVLPEHVPKKKRKIHKEIIV